MRKFVPRDDLEREACKIEGPKFVIGERVRFIGYHAEKGESIIREIILRQVNLPYWLFMVEGFDRTFDSGDLEAIEL